MPATNYTTEQEAIVGRIAGNWTATAVAWPNAHFDPTEELVAGVDEGYLEPIVTRQEAFNADISEERRVRHPGLLTGNLRVFANIGDGPALVLADAFADLFRNVTFDGITFRAPTVRPIGREGAWYRVQVDCPFWRDSIH